MSAQSGFADAARGGGRAALVTVVRSQGGDPPVGAKVLVTADGAREGSLGETALDDRAARAAEELMWAERSELREVGELGLFVDVTFPAPRAIVFGAVDYAGALCRLARTCGWRPYVVDPRTRFATAERFPEAERVVAAWPQEAFAQLGGIDRATYIAVLTHDPKLDDAVLEIALRSEAAYVGAMGSRRAQEQRRERLAGKVSDEELARLAAPIGLDLGATTSEETALSIMAEMVAVRHGHRGGRLSARGAGRVHEVGA